MKVTLDLDQLLADHRISQDEYERLASLAARDTASLALNVLVAFGVVAVAGATIALLKSASVTTMLGVGLAAAGLGADRVAAERWQPLGTILLLVGSLTAAGGVVATSEGAPLAWAALAVGFGAMALVARSGFLAALSPLALLAASGGRGGYEHALYWLGVEQPLMTIVLFGGLAALAHWWSLGVPPERGRLVTIFARTCLFVVNLGFWIGSLWGDALHRRGASAARWTPVVPDWVFVIAWAVALVAAGVWAARRNQRAVVSIVTVFAAIHFYTQYFERLGATPGSVLVAGLLVLALAVVLIRYNRHPR